MKNIDKAILLAAAGAVGLCAVALPAPAEDPASPPANSSAAPGQAWAKDQPDAVRHHGWRAASRKSRMRRLIRRLDLNDAQRAQLRHLHAQTMVEIWSARADGSLTVDQLRARVRTAFKAEREGFHNLLTDQQRAKLDKMTRPSDSRP
jgi:Spy/CpxP family protein refolding chaperone